MSRIEQAWRRASGAAAQNAELAEHEDQPKDVALHRYPQESGAPVLSAEHETDRLLHRTIVAPRAVERKQLGSLHDAFARKLVVGNASPIAVEQYRRLAGSLHELQMDRGLKTLMVSSALPNEGKTLTIVNLALTLSESCGHRVLLIDADLRRPFVHEIFRIPNAKGLSDVLRSDRGEAPLLEVSEHLSVLPAGHLDQPMAALTSDRMRGLLEQSAAAFDWVLLDAAPVGFMPDAQLLAHLTGAVLFVIAANSTPHQLVTRAIAALDPERVVGTVLNSVLAEHVPAAAYYADYYATARR